MHADRFNRFALLIFGLVMLVAGAAAMALSVGLFGTRHSHRALFDNVISRYVGGQGQWLWPTAAVVGVVITLLALRWILTLLVSTDRSGDLELPGGRKGGRTMMKANALSSAVVAEIETYRGVAVAKARTVGDSAAARLIVEVTALRGADIAELGRRIETEALSNAREAMGRRDLPVRLDLTVGSKSLRRL